MGFTSAIPRVWVAQNVSCFLSLNEAKRTRWHNPQHQLISKFEAVASKLFLLQAARAYMFAMFLIVCESSALVLTDSVSSDCFNASTPKNSTC